MPATQVAGHELLEYNQEYRIIICRECQYAIQKNAFESHLLRHKIYRGDRQRLLSSIAHLELPEPDHVRRPPAGAPAIKTLELLAGFRCSAASCGHLTVSSKRMRRHWSEVHGQRNSIASLTSLAVPVKLQTFFRGTKIGYFEVSSDEIPAVQQDDSNRGVDAAAVATATSLGVSSVTLEADTVLHRGAPIDDCLNSSTVGIDLDTLRYFHHFTTATSTSLPGLGDAATAARRWQCDVVQQALQTRWLMCGILALSAYHLTTSSNDLSLRHGHAKRAACFSREFARGWAVTQESTDGMDDARVGRQIDCLIQCAQRAAAAPTFKDEDPRRLHMSIAAIRGCVDVNSGPRQENRDNTGEFDDIDHGSDSAPIDSVHSHVPVSLLNHTRQLPFRIAKAVGQPETPQDVFSTLSAIAALVECYKISYASGDPFTAWKGAFMWLNTVPEHFNRMVAREHAAALVVVAHWAAVPLRRAEEAGCWFLKGSAQALIARITQQLAAEGSPALGLVEDVASKRQ